jgi:WXXGXW repeat (2 copies)
MTKSSYLLAAAAIGFGFAGALAAPTPSQAQVSVFVSVRIAPPPLPAYIQPPCPEYGYIWVPGYWAWDDDDEDFYWVPGTWVRPPRLGWLWTPGWWEYGWNGYVYHEGYWGERVGWYGGINYGFGYSGYGYEGGYWRDGRIFYNRTVNNVTNVTNVYIYNKTVVNNINVTRVSYNGGQGGVQAQPTLAQRMVGPVIKSGPTEDQLRHVQTARAAPVLHAAQNRGAPPVATTFRPAAIPPAILSRGAPIHGAAETVHTPFGANPAGPANHGPAPQTPTRNAFAESRPAWGGGQPQLSSSSRGVQDWARPSSPDLRRAAPTTPPQQPFASEVRASYPPGGPPAWQRQPPQDERRATSNPPPPYAPVVRGSSPPSGPPAWQRQTPLQDERRVSPNLLPQPYAPVVRGSSAPSAPPSAFRPPAYSPPAQHIAPPAAPARPAPRNEITDRRDDRR